MSGKNIMIVAGEPSGDLHASHVAHQLKKRCPDITLFGMGGDAMETASVTILKGESRFAKAKSAVSVANFVSNFRPSADLHIRDSAVMGFTDVLTHLPTFLQKQALLKQQLRDKRPNALLLVDFAEFNMPLAKYAHSLRIPVIYYIPPKAWAWRAHRARKLAKWADVIAAIFPFEAEFYRNAGATAEYVGHPILDIAHTPLTPHQARERLNLSPADPVIGVMPGSRRSEIHHILPVMLKAAANIAEIYPNAHWILPVAPGISPNLIRTYPQELEPTHPIPPIKIVENSTYIAMRASTLLLVTSGTATLEAACIGTPMIILFRTSALNWRIIRTLSPLTRSGLPNLIAGHDIVPELLQTALTPTALTELALDFLGTPEKRETQQQALKVSLRTHLYGNTAGAAERTAELVLSLIKT